MHENGGKIGGYQIIQIIELLERPLTPASLNPSSYDIWDSRRTNVCRTNDGRNQTVKTLKCV